MLKKLRQIYEELKIYARAPEIFSLLIILTLAAILFGINIFFAPFYLVLITILVFLGTAVVIINGYLGLARLNREIEVKTAEFQAATANLKDGIIIYDTNFKILNLNRAGEEILEIKAQEILGEKISPEFIKNRKFKILTQVLFPTLAPTAVQLSEDSWPQIVRLELDDPPLKLHTILNRLINNKGETIGFIKIVRDETREKEIIESKSEFISVAAHQLRTPLTALNWSLENLTKEADEDPNLKEKLKNSRDLVERMLKIVNDFLDVVKIEEGKFGYKFQDVELVNFINQIISHVKPVADEYNIKVIFNAPPKNYPLRTDPNRLGIALTNLIDNAIRYNTKDGSVILNLEEVDGGRFIKVEISDTGVGIPQEDIKKLFDKFYRGKNAIQIEPNGSGLGLYITKNIIKRLGGNIDVKSDLGRGTTFWFTLPVDKSLVPEKEMVYEE